MNAQLCYHPDCAALATMALFACKTHWDELPNPVRLKLNNIAVGWIEHRVSNMEFGRLQDHIREDMRRRRLDARLEEFVRAIGKDGG